MVARALYDIVAEIGGKLLEQGQNLEFQEIQVCFGCEYGKHRSVTIALEVGKRLQAILKQIIRRINNDCSSSSGGSNSGIPIDGGYADSDLLEGSGRGINCMTTASDLIVYQHRDIEKDT